MNDNEDLVREAYDAYVHGDLETMLSFVDVDLEWTYLDPSFVDPEPQVCHGRRQLEDALKRQAALGLHASIEEISARGARVLVVVRTPGADQRRARQTGDLDYTVLTVRDGRIVALRDCRDRQEAAAFAGVE